MKIAEDFRRIARNALTNKWFIAVAVGLVASILGGISGGGPEFKVNIDGSNISMNFNVAGQTIKSIGTNGGVDSEVGAFILASLPIIIIASLFAAVIYFALGSFIGWDILATLAFGIGHLWLTPYKQAAYAAFYREVSGTEFYPEEDFEIN